MTTTPTTSTPVNGSRTQIITDVHPEEGPSNPAPIGTLRLRAAARNRQRVEWDENVVDNEGCGRKSSKICCIYHKPRKFDESSSEEDSDSDSDVSINARRRRRRSHNHNHDHSADGLDGPHATGLQARSDQSTTVHQIDHEEDRNAYESVPSSRKGKKKEESR